MKIYGKLRNRFSLSLARNFYLVVTCAVSFYLVCLMTFVLNDDYQWNLFKSSDKIAQNNKSIQVNNSKSGETSEDKSFKGRASSGNYFLQVDRLKNLQRIVDTPACKIPDFDVWDKDVFPFLKVAQPDEKCNETHYNWSFVRNNKLVINRRQIERDGYRLYKGFCCYKFVERVTLSNIEARTISELKDADNLIKYSSCIDINNEETELHHEFIVVECGSIKFIPVAVRYRAFHASAVVKGSQKSQNVEKKILHWKSEDAGQERLPPNVLIFGLDSTSRLNFRRNMFETRRFLENIGAVEMLGYTKVGENTFPNFVALSAGYSEDDLIKVCYFSKLTPQDKCPYISKRFDSANYITAHSEDAPTFAIYNYLKTGFVQQPVDFNNRPIMLAAQDYAYPPFYVGRSEAMKCIGQQTNDEVILAYVESVLDIGHRNKTPIYSVSWSTEGSHGNSNGIQLVDATYANFFKRIQEKGYLDNTLLIFMGDHGYRYGPFRETILGYYEDKLPNMWIRLPPWIKEEFPEWQTALEINSRRLSSPFTMYWTLNRILEMFSSIDPPHDSINANLSGKLVPRKHTLQNFFEILPEDNTCADVGIPDDFCACYLPQQVLLDDPLLRKAALAALESKNQDLINSPCAPLQVKAITAGTVVTKFSKDLVKRFIVAFTTKPGDFTFEVEIDYFMGNSTFNAQPSVHRISAINKEHITCIKDSKLELYCYCA
ncbi:uncharacterized protein LOC110847822 [Folsomia candida]|uniref:uncharacterized protein LOC110847822 n=1 Tax=Folsomia candida TaxID=158441 RepID=UPI000B8F50A4|nr:uncharacterized protein LOC110847822 [Folsomia candida]